MKKSLLLIFFALAVNVFADPEDVWESHEMYYNFFSNWKKFNFLSVIYKIKNKEVVKYWQCQKSAPDDLEKRNRPDDSIPISSGEIKESRKEGEFDVYVLTEEFITDPTHSIEGEVIYIHRKTGEMKVRHANLWGSKKYGRISLAKAKETAQGH